MSQIVYHGSYIAIDKVDLTFSGTSKDFGCGFYVTNLFDQAQTWANRIARNKHTKGVVTEFKYSEFIAREMDMKVLRFDGYTDEWLDFVVLNRINDSQTPAHNYDIVEGPVADDRITRQVDRFIAGKLSREQFMSELMYLPSHQICFCTAQSLQALESTLTRQRIICDIYDIGWEVTQALMSEYGLSELEATDMYYTSQTYALVAEEASGYYQKPWREIYGMLLAELEI